MTAIDTDLVIQSREFTERSHFREKGHHGAAASGDKNSSSPVKSKSKIGHHDRNIRRRNRVYPGGGSGMVSRKSGTSLASGTKAATSSHNLDNVVNLNEENRPARRRKSAKSKTLKIDTSIATDGEAPSTPKTVSSTPGIVTPPGRRGSKDLRSPGITQTPVGAKVASPNDPVPDLITQTDRFGNAATPRSKDAIETARVLHPSGPKPSLHVDAKGKLTEDPTKISDADACESLLDSIRFVCCCLLPEDSPCAPISGESSAKNQQQETVSEESQDKVERVKLLPKHHPDDVGKKCLVLDLDETLVHSSFRAVPGADFVIPVQIEDVVHFVYVAKRPGVDEFLTEMAKHYEIVVYTASLNKYADPLLDLLDPNRVIRCRLFRESCVYYEGNYVKDLSLLDRDLSQAIIVDNSPSSYIFHPENAIDCSSFIDDPMDRELDQIAAFLEGVKDVKDVRNTCQLWREWPNVDLDQFVSTTNDR